MENSNIVKLICLYFLLFNSCTSNYQHFEEIVYKIDKGLKTDTNNQGLFQNIWITDLTNQLKLPLHDSSKSDFELRVWYNLFGLRIKNRLVIINKKGNAFTGNLIRFSHSYENSKFVYNKLEDRQSIPVSGWESFSNKLFSTHFLNLFEKQFYGMQGRDDAEDFIFEVFTRNNYWHADFNEPYAFKGDSKSISSAIEILKLIEDEFNFHEN